MSVLDFMKLHTMSEPEQAAAKAFWAEHALADA